MAAAAPQKGGPRGAGGAAKGLAGTAGMNVLEFRVQPKLSATQWAESLCTLVVRLPDPSFYIGVDADTKDVESLPVGSLTLLEEGDAVEAGDGRVGDEDSSPVQRALELPCKRFAYSFSTVGWGDPAWHGTNFTILANGKVEFRVPSRDRDAARKLDEFLEPHAARRDNRDEQQRGDDIGVYGSHGGRPGTAFLRGEKVATRADAESIVRQVYAESRRREAKSGEAMKMFTEYPDRVFVDSLARRRLTARLDAAHRANPQLDTKLVLTPAELEAIIGAAAVKSMTEVFGTSIDLVKLRRVEAGPSGSAADVINFHLDVARRTMGVPLNDESEYSGSRLVFATAECGFVRAQRNVGSATIHDDTIVHGVTPLTAGTRYGLFLLAH